MDVSGLTSGVQAIAAGGYDHTCALTTGGGVKCWGNNAYGQLGDGTTTTRQRPVDVSGLSSGIRAITASRSHSCALTTGGSVKCWGWNKGGQLGDGTTTNRQMPVNVNGLTSNVQAISASSTHTCALTTSGGVKCWGVNEYGQLGDGTTTDRLTPVEVSGLTSGVQAITLVSGHTCVLTTEGGVKCWGYNYYGQVGDGTSNSRLTPVDVSGLTSGVKSIATGGAHTCALTTSGGVKCWGWNEWGQLGDGTTIERWTPVDVSGLTSGVQTISAVDHTCALTMGGGVKCWGSNWYGQLGDGTTTTRPTPVDVIDPNAALTDAADLESQMPYPTTKPGAALNLWINVRNTGDSTWQASSGYGWRGTDKWEGQTGSITGPIAPNEVWSFSRDIIAPAEPGTYVYGFVLQHNGADFGPAFFIQVTVAPSAVLSNYTVNAHGYSFLNGLAYTAVLTSTTVYNIFGDSVCWLGKGPDCVIRPEAAKWADNEALNSVGGQ